MKNKFNIWTKTGTSVIDIFSLKIGSKRICVNDTINKLDISTTIGLDIKAFKMRPFAFAPVRKSLMGSLYDVTKVIPSSKKTVIKQPN